MKEKFVFPCVKLAEPSAQHQDFTPGWNRIKPFNIQTSDCLDQILVVKTAQLEYDGFVGGEETSCLMTLLCSGVLFHFPRLEDQKQNQPHEVSDGFYGVWSWPCLPGKSFRLTSERWKTTPRCPTAFSDHTETSSQEEAQKPSHATRNWSRLRWVAVISLGNRLLSVLFQTESSLH